MRSSHYLFALLVPFAILFSAQPSARAAFESPHGPLTLECQLCHTTDNWTKIKYDSGFVHDVMTKFPLVGRHKSVSCVSCHSSLLFADAGTECLDCHTDVHRGQFSENCSQCHTPHQWADDRQFRKAHELTRFPLVGVHATLDCQSCHSEGKYANLTTECIGCHAEEYASTAAPHHPTAGFSVSCTECHSLTTAKWVNAEFAHPAGFPLTGGHALNDCQACHAQGFSGTSTACATCHAEDYSQAQNPTHEEGAFPNSCEMCHTTTSWKPAEFNNHAQTAFPLSGRHVEIDCAQCHIGGQYTGTATECVGCHQTDYTDATNPVHVTPAFGETCNACHSTNNWRPATFGNHDQTAFPLTGAHVATDCAQCHVGGQYTGTPVDCWSCHEADYTGVQDPNHVTGAFPQNCAVCHSTLSWQDATFDHNLTAFPLTGAHVQTDCAQCHVGGVYDGTPTDCWSCHQGSYESAEGHVQNNYPHDCALCHTTATWEGATFDHNSSDFPLTGAHVQVNCNECHSSGIYDGLPFDCWSCHQEDYNGADDHVENNFPHDCAVCHNTSDWGESTFNHNNSSFPLTGAHVQADCNECHSSGIYNGLPSDCWSCHQEDYNDAEGHVENNFPHDCTQCHNTTDWDSDFNHADTDFPLTGAHVAVNCLVCHVGGQFENTPTDCWFCHQADYNGASPDHNEGYPQTCEDCHSTSNWNSTFNHDQQYFPIYSGRHEGEWNLCNECHTTSGNFSVFSCIDCHEHSNQGDVDDDHEDVSGYTYTPTSCYACHPDGNEGPNIRRTKIKTVKPGATEVQK